MSRALIVLLLAVFSDPAAAQVMFSKDSFKVSQADDGQCRKNKKVRIDAQSAESFELNRLKVQEVAKLARTYIWLNCDEMETLTLEGYDAVGEAVYRGKIEAKSDWKLVGLDQKTTATEEGVDHTEAASVPTPFGGASVADANETAKNVDQPSGVQPKAVRLGDDEQAPKFETADQLNEAAQGNANAQLELARQQLSLPDKQPGLDIEPNVQHGVSLLEALAQQGNAEAIHALGQAYALNPDLSVNYDLVSKLAGQPVSAKTGSQEFLGALMSGAALMRGSQSAAKAFFNAGAGGASSAYYLLGNSYLLDRKKRMPYGKRFTSRAYKLRSSGNGFRAAAGRGRYSSAGLGSHFMGMSAAMGNAGAAGFLSSVGESAGSASGASGSSAGASNTSEPQGRGAGPGGPFDVVLQNNAQQLQDSEIFERMIEAQMLADYDADASAKQSAKNAEASGRGGAAGAQQGGAAEASSVSGGGTSSVGASSTLSGQSSQTDPGSSERGVPEIID